MADRQGRYGNGRYRMYKRPMVLLIALVLLVGLGVGATVGLLQTRTSPVQNDFTYGKVTCEVLETVGEENGIWGKRDVKIRNTGNTDAYIRVLLVFTWKDKDGNIFVYKPVKNQDFQINLALSNGWILSNNDIGASYIYYKYPVAPGASTPILIDGVRQAAEVTGPENGKYALSVEILAEAVQAEPEQAVSDAWGATIEADGALHIKGGIGYETEPTETKGE